MCGRISWNFDLIVILALELDTLYSKVVSVLTLNAFLQGSKSGPENFQKIILLAEKRRQSEIHWSTDVPVGNNSPLGLKSEGRAQSTSLTWFAGSEGRAQSSSHVVCRVGGESSIQLSHVVRRVHAIACSHSLF